MYFTHSSSSGILSKSGGNGDCASEEGLGDELLQLANREPFVDIVFLCCNYIFLISCDHYEINHFYQLLWSFHLEIQGFMAKDIWTA